jgi:curved DNA-binding protein CbpA
MEKFAEQYKNYYELLGISEKAGPEEIRQAYLMKIKAWHPDKNPDRQARAEEMTKTLNQAYHILSDPERRRNYDRMLRYTKGRDFSKHINDEAFWKKIEKAYPAMQKIIKNVRELYAMFSDSVKGKYKLHPSNLAMIGGGLLYFILPADLIPDLIPFVGYLDDLAILTTIINSLPGEILQYRRWKESTEKPS